MCNMGRVNEWCWQWIVKSTAIAIQVTVNLHDDHIAVQISFIYLYSFYSFHFRSPCALHKSATQKNEMKQQQQQQNSTKKRNDHTIIQF